MLYIFIIVAFIIVIFAGTGLIVYAGIHSATKANSEYETFVKANNYRLTQAMGRLAYRQSRSRTLEIGVNLRIAPEVKQFADYSSYPFGRGTDRKVAYVIEGNYNNAEFRAFTYKFTGSLLDGGGYGGLFGIVMIFRDDESDIKSDLPKNVFCEGNIICQYSKGNLKVETIHETIDELIKIKEKK